MPLKQIKQQVNLSKEKYLHLQKVESRLKGTNKINQNLSEVLSNKSKRVKSYKNLKPDQSKLIWSAVQSSQKLNSSDLS